MMDETPSCTHEGSSYFCPVFLGHPLQNSTSIGDFVKGCSMLQDFMSKEIKMDAKLDEVCYKAV